mmetsp:Transcript_27927/g.86386  ORF Transcript_27927/g.86386 Transcript_27927/m.86386 type:complete len:143 (-) Transcript_27927:94-522(-)
MATGIGVADDVITKFDAFKLKKAGDVKIISLKIEGKQVVIDQEFGADTPWAKFHSEMLNGPLENEPRYILLDYDYKTTDGREADKIILISWIPDTSKVMLKMKYAGTKEAVKSALQGIAINLNATDMAEAGEDSIKAACVRI